MTNFGTLKTKMLSKLTEAYTKKNKAEMKDILNTIKENKDFKEMYLFYEDIETKYFDNKENAKQYVDGIGSILKNHMVTLQEFCDTLDKKIDISDINENEVYTALDHLCERDMLGNVEKKVAAKNRLMEHLTTKREPVVSEDTTYTSNENLLHAVLANNFNVLYNNNLTEEQKEELKSILSLSNEEIETKTVDLKESILSSVSTLLNEANDSDLSKKLNDVKDEVSKMSPSRYNIYRLTELKNGLN
jgi:hypothetical protein